MGESGSSQQQVRKQDTRAGTTSIGQGRWWVSWNMMGLSFCLGGLVMAYVFTCTPWGRHLVLKEDGPKDRAIVKLPGMSVGDKKPVPPQPLAPRDAQQGQDAVGKPTAKEAAPDPMAELQRINEINNRNRQRMSMSPYPPPIPGPPRGGFDLRNPGVPAGPSPVPPGGPHIPGTP